MKLNRFTQRFASMLIVMAAHISCSLVAVAEVFNPDHYISYDIKAMPFHNVEVSLHDQFIDWIDFEVIAPIKLLNPTVKRHNNKVFEIQNPQLYYVSYKIKPTESITINKEVIVTNQFGQFVIKEFRPAQLLVPSHKLNLSPFSKNKSAVEVEQIINADHYLCYDIPPITLTSEQGFLSDEFRAREFGTLTAKKLCNPVAKRHHGKISDIENDIASNHLMCFEMDNKRIFRAAAYVNQFGTKKVIALKDDEVCVPSHKQEIAKKCVDSAPDENLTCDGVCANSTDVCRPSFAGECVCVSEHPQPCTGTLPGSDHTCDGYCPKPTQVCLPSLTSDFCACISTGPLFCEDSTPDDARMCNGICRNPSEVCKAVPNQELCSCILIP